MKKKYDVYGLGNALVDIIFEVEDDFLTDHKVEKGFMTLVDEEKQHRLIGDMNINQNTMQCGGSAANTIVSISQFGGHCYYTCKVAGDEYGKFYIEDLERCGVKTNLDHDHLENGITGKCLVMVTPDAERTMNTYLGITTNLSPADVHEEALKESEYLYMEGYLVSSEDGFKAIMKAKKMAEKHDVKKVLSFSDPSMVKYFGDNMKMLTNSGGLDLLFSNEEEAQIFTGKNDIKEVCEDLEKVAKTFVVTLGKKGSLVYDGENYHEIEPNIVKAIDTVGAGDMFAGAFLYALSIGKPLQEAGKFASLASSKVVQHHGPRLGLHQVNELLKEAGITA